MSEKTPPLGSLRDRVQLQRKFLTTEDGGGQDITFMPLANVWARVYRRNAHMTDRSGARGAEHTHSVVLRYRADIESGDRIVYRGRKLEVITASDLNGKRAYLSCACREMQVA